MAIGTDVNTTAGSKLYVSENLPTVDTLAGFQAVTSYTEVGEITDMGEVVNGYDSVTHTSIDSRFTKTLKGVKSANTATYTIGRVVDDVGQALLREYNNGSTNLDDMLTFKIVHKDGTVFYGAGLVMSVNVSFGDANTVTALTVTVAFNTHIHEDTSTTYHTLRYLAGTGGIVIGATTQRVADGEDGEYVYAVADDGKTFSKWTPGDLTTNPRQDTAIAADATYTATFV